MALRYPDAVEEAPWGQLVMKVRRKVFCFLGDGKAEGEDLNLTFKLPRSADDALSLEFAAPAGHGLGRHGWVSFRYPDGEEAPVEQLVAWLDESYRAVAPRRLVKTLPDAGPPLTPEPQPTPEPISIGGPMLLVGDDPLRLARSRRWLDARGIDVPDLAPLTPEAVAIASEVDPVAMVIDVSRNAERGLDLLEIVGSTSFSARPVLVSGLRDARMKRRAQIRLPGAMHSTDAPGDDGLLTEFVGRVASRTLQSAAPSQMTSAGMGTEP